MIAQIQTNYEALMILFFKNKLVEIAYEFLLDESEIPDILNDMCRKEELPVECMYIIRSRSELEALCRTYEYSSKFKPLVKLMNQTEEPTA